MKKILIAAILLLSLNSIGQTSGAVTLKYPFGTASTCILDTNSTTVNIVNNVTYVSTVTNLAANATLNITVSSKITAGAILHLRVKTAASQTVTFGTGIDAPVVTGSAGKTWCQSFWYDGTTFYPCGAKIQID